MTLVATRTVRSKPLSKSMPVREKALILADRIAARGLPARVVEMVRDSGTIDSSMGQEAISRRMENLALAETIDFPPDEIRAQRARFVLDVCAAPEEELPNHDLPEIALPDLLSPDFDLADLLILQRHKTLLMTRERGIGGMTDLVRAKALIDPLQTHTAARLACSLRELGETVIGPVRNVDLGDQLSKLPPDSWIVVTEHPVAIKAAGKGKNIDVVASYRAPNGTDHVLSAISVRSQLASIGKNANNNQDGLEGESSKLKAFGVPAIGIVYLVAIDGLGGENVSGRLAGDATNLASFPKCDGLGLLIADFHWRDSEDWANRPEIIDPSQIKGVSDNLANRISFEKLFGRLATLAIAAKPTKTSVVY